MRTCGFVQGASGIGGGSGKNCGGVQVCGRNKASDGRSVVGKSRAVQSFCVARSEMGASATSAVSTGSERSTSRFSELEDVLRTQKMVADAARRNASMKATASVASPAPLLDCEEDGLLLSVDALEHALCAASDKLVVVKFYAPWCRSCRMIGKQLEKLRAKYGAQVEFYDVSFETAKPMFRELGIKAMPTIHMYHHHEKIDDFSVGPARAKLIAEKVDAFVSSMPSVPSAE
eukprot:CAMPEP_0185846726 /NCGR_PEP_ID=MMETSP1354-20130828/2267_1 /TAXON_ID=708628 /ORGANISM="Erythrolobus madagascarensis, Strain CCMP3276" /LENGTH=231 /DNA_ID=CAMNT_0028546923 /DNA_START=94 /DNA_END=789 /DNA_ORIENTATION=-